MPKAAAGPPATKVGAGKTDRLMIVLKGYPRVSETFIAQELYGLEQAGLQFDIVSLRHPYDSFRHAIHDQIAAPVMYLPETLIEEPARVAAAFAKTTTHRGFWRALVQFAKDFVRDPTVDRLRRFGQALVLAAEASDRAGWLHAHFAHTPTSVARYASIMLDVPFSISAHAKDIWTTRDWDLREKLSEAHWTVTCTKSGAQHLSELAPNAAVHLSYHGLDLDRFPPAPQRHASRDGSDSKDPVRLVSVGRAVPKKGYDTLLKALARLPQTLSWRFEHIGRGPELETIKAQAAELGLGDRVLWRGPQNQTEVLAAYRRSDIFVLASRQTADGDRDGLPNVLVEAASQGLACIATDISAIPELIEDRKSGLLIRPEDPDRLATALSKAIRDPDLRARLGDAAAAKVRQNFDFLPGIRRLKALFENGWRPENSASHVE